MKEIEDFLLKHSISAKAVDIDNVFFLFNSEMDKGLRGEESSLAMIPTYISGEKKEIENEKVLVIDAGGSNLRTCLVTFNQGKAEISDFEKTRMPGADGEVSKDEFFSHLASKSERLIEKADRIGFCFSYSTEITEDHDGRAINLAKEIKAPEIIGVPLIASLLKEFERRGHDVKKKKGIVLNDTVTTLLASQTQVGDFSSYIGFILGTGTNAAYIERSENIKKARVKEGTNIIDVESGYLDLELGDIDRAFRETTENRNMSKYEKAISGAYLGPLCYFVAKEAMEEGLFSSSFVKEFDKIERLNTKRMGDFLDEKSDSELFSLSSGYREDIETLGVIFKAVIERAALLSAINITVAAERSGQGKTMERPVLVNIDGTTFYKTRYLEELTAGYLDKICRDERGIYYKRTFVENSPIIGAAIAGASL